MLPKVPEPPISGKHTIFVNPNFKRDMTQYVNTRDRQRSQEVGPQNFNVKPHVNPLFLRKNVLPSATKPIPTPLPSRQVPKKTPTIHMNPKFLMNPIFLQSNLVQTPLYQQQHQRQHPTTVSQITNNGEVRSEKQFLKSTEYVSKKENLNIMEPKFEMPSSTPGSAPLVHLSRTKLVRKPVIAGKINLSIAKPIAASPVNCKANTKLDISNPKKRYKIDRTKSSQNPAKEPPRKILNTRIIKKKYIHKNKSSLGASNTPATRKNLKLINHSKLNKKLKLIKINNILYKTTPNTLLRNDLETSKSLKTVEELSVLQNSASKINARNHISNAKSRSMQQLRKRFVKTNEPCIIFQRLGKCAAYQKGRCNKKHDKEQVVICPKYLRGECYDTNCLLSHNVCLSKMPVCKFYLQANCFRDKCPYLHKKLSQKAEICTDFVRGYCPLAEKCNKRHEFMCPDLALKKKCVQPSCIFCKPKKKFKKQFKLVTSKPKETTSINREELIEKILTFRVEAITKLSEAKEAETKGNDDNDNTCPITRYFERPPTNKNLDQSMNLDPAALDKTDSNNTEEASSTIETVGPSIFRKRPQLGFLPAFIPLS